MKVFQRVSNTLSIRETFPPRTICNIRYVIVDDAIKKIIETGPCENSYQAHIPSSLILTMEWKQSLYMDTCLPFGLTSAPKLFNILADLLAWITKWRGVSFSMHYLDDFLLVGPPDSPICQHNLDVFTQVCKELGIPLATEILGILIDTHHMEVHLPDDCSFSVT